MRGFPPFQLLLVVLGFVALAAALAIVTRPREAGATLPTTSTPVLEELSARLIIRWAHRPENLTITHEGHVWVDFSVPQLTAPYEASVSYPHQKHGSDNVAHQIECLIQAHWPVGTPETALTLTLEPAGHDPVTTTIWGQESLEEIVVFKP